MKEIYDKNSKESKLEETKCSSINRKIPEKPKKNLTGNIITYTIAIIILFLQSIFILFSILKNGFMKKEVLTKKSNFGFDIIIKS